jgi:ribose-phosphate pyrophosphokinase
VIQPLVPPVQEHLIEPLLMLDAPRGASAARTTAVIAYARSDKKDAADPHRRTPTTARR